MPLFRNVGHLVASYNAASGAEPVPYQFNGVDFLFDAQETSSMHQDPFQTTVVLASGDTIGYINDVALPTEG
jgi:hypothetical protein